MKNLKLIALSLIISVNLIAQNESNTRIAYLKEICNYLASDELEGRETGTKGEEKAAKFIAKQFKQLGLEPMGEDESYFQTFSFKPKPHPHASEKELENVAPIMGKNVIGFINNNAENTIVLGAHYDHLGHGTHQEGSLYSGKEPMVHNGADDNASGVSTILLMAKELKQRKDLMNNNYLIIAFSGEEKGLFGSSYYAKNATVKVENINYMINLDMVGRYREDKGLAINGTGTSPLWPDKIKKVNTQNIIVVSDASGIGPSDHTSFYLKNIPVLHFFTGQHEDYHKPSDDVEKLNYEGMLIVADFITNLIAANNWEGKIEFTETKQENSTKAPKFSVTLGVMPDYMFSGKGMKIDGIIDDRPGQKAGLHTGDVVIKLGEVEVTDMKTYMEALGKLNKGDETTIEILRNNQPKTLPIKF